MRLFTSYLVVLATAIAACASVAQAGSSSPAIRALELRGQGMNALCSSPTTSRETYVVVCGTRGAANQPTRAELRALQIRGQGLDVLYGPKPSAAVQALQIRGEDMNALCENPTLPRESYVSVCGTRGAANQPTRAVLQALEIRGEAMNAATAVPVTASSGSFSWGDFSIGAASMLGFLLLAGGISAAVHFGRRSTVRPRTVS